MGKMNEFISLRRYPSVNWLLFYTNELNEFLWIVCPLFLQIRGSIEAQ